MPVLELEQPPVAATAPTLEVVLLRALADPEGEPCPVCGGALERTPGGAGCRGCGSRVERGGEPSRGAWVDAPAPR